MGSCLLANIAIGVRALQARGALGRVAVVDWDVHHGNGTEAIFFDDPSVLTISIHQDRLYPAATGGIDSRGKGAGEGFNINVPLPPGSGRAAYLRTMEKIVLPALARFAPDFIICACGFDASALDPLGRMLLTSADFGAMTAMLMDAARQYCGDRLVLCHEGGYSATYVPFCGAAVIETLLGGPSAVEDPILPACAADAQDPIAAHQLGAVEAARAAARL
jgi:acetoin utilization deacetylase AcuC-like enzyme